MDSGAAAAAVVPRVLLIGAVAGIGVLHTLVPDHWLPIAIVARQEGWSRRETASAALRAGLGHVITTLAIGLAAWGAGTAFALRFGSLVSNISGLALVGFGAWIGLAALREVRQARGNAHPHAHTHDGHEHVHAAGPNNHNDPRGPADDRKDPHKRFVSRAGRVPLETGRGGAAVLTRHVHAHRHSGGAPHAHLHEHTPATWHDVPAQWDGEPPRHVHTHKRSARTALPLILGSSPMVEGIPAFFAASKYGFELVAIMALAFGLSTIVTYVALCVYSTAQLRRVKFGRLENYGEVISGAFIALVGAVFLALPAL